MLYFDAIWYRVSPFFTVQVFPIFSSVVPGSFNVCPGYRLSDIKLFNVFSSFTVVPQVEAILYSVSPDETVCVVGKVVLVPGIFNTCPICNVFDVKLFVDFNFSTVVSNFFAIVYKLSPFFTV